MYKLIIILLFITSCGVSKKSPTYNKTSLDELKTIRGEEGEEESIPVKNSKIIVFENGDKFQIQDDKVTHGYFQPSSDEKNLIYWNHKFKNCKTESQKLYDESQPNLQHDQREILLKCNALGAGVVYQENTNRVLRVLKYESQ